mmetsp:Transcript_29011/g.81160  ORF Transcript_29011/g.81160 Transcript_29011/m.81160 type:complete len:411 (-) Transcript_29011:664-1896(-)
MHGRRSGGRRSVGGCAAEGLPVHEGCIGASGPRQEVGVGPVLHHAAVVQHEDLVGASHRAQAMGNHERGAAPHDPLQSLLHQSLALGVERAGGLVQQQHSGVLQHSPGYGYPLLLAPAQLDALLADLRVVAVREAQDHLVDVRRLGGLHHRIRHSAGGRNVIILLPQQRVHYVVADGPREKHGLLAHQPDVPVQPAAVQAVDRRAVQEDRARRRLVEVLQKVEQRGLAGPRGPHQRGHCPRRSPQGHLVQHLHAPRGVREGHAPELHLPQAAGRGQAIRRGLVRLPVQQVEDLGAGPAALHEVGERVQQHVAPVLQVSSVGQEGHELGHLQLRLGAEVRAVDEDDELPARVHQKGVHAHVVHPVGDGLPCVERVVALHPLAVPAALVPLVGESEDCAEAGQHLLRHDVRV